MIKLSLDRVDTGSFDELVDAFPSEAFSSPARSTLPLLDHWRTPEERLREIGSAMNLQICSPVTLSFEYEVAVRQGRGKPSCTDLMIAARDVAVAVEAKYTEPMYQTVGSWLEDATSANRLTVLLGWLELIQGATGRSLSELQVNDIPYQMIHRLASVCSMSQCEKAMAYLIYGSNAAHYRPFLDVLRELIGHDTVRIFLFGVPVSPTPHQTELQNRWMSGERDLAQDIRASIKLGPLFSYGSVQTVAAVQA